MSDRTGMLNGIEREEAQLVSLLVSGAEFTSNAKNIAAYYLGRCTRVAFI